MKKILFLAMMALVFVGCSSDDEEKGILLDKSSITIKWNEGEIIKASEPVEWSTENPFFVKVTNEGKAIGVHAGKTYVVASSGNKEARCEVIVEPLFHTYTEPICDFGTSKNVVKSKEKRILLKEEANTLYYLGENSNITAIAYLFEDGKLTGSLVNTTYKIENSFDILSFIYERYEQIGVQNGIIYFINNEIDKHTMGVALELTFKDATVYYMQNISKTRNSDSIIEKLNKIIK